jgi:DNA-binding transcriptional LysR family regulator
MQNVNWDDLRYSLAVVREGSVTAAARKLGVNHTTVSRRVSALEQELGANLFDRSTAGWLLTPFGESILGAVQQMDEEVHAIRRQATADHQELSGRIRVTAVDVSFQSLLLRGLRSFTRQHPEIVIDLIASDVSFNLAVHEADIAFRATNEPPPNVLGTRVGNFAVSVYATPELIERHAADPASVGAMTMAGDSRIPPWLPRYFPSMPVRCTYNSLSVAFDLARAGIGFAMLPCGLGDMAPELRRVMPGFHEPGLDLWVLSHIDLRTTARLRMFRDHMLAAIAPHVPLMEGQRENAWQDPLYAKDLHT